MENTKPVKLILDTDIGCDCDDAGALAMIHRLCDKGEAELLAVTHCYSSAYVAGCIDAINTFYGRKVPIGINYADERNKRDIYAGVLCDVFPNDYPSCEYKTEKGAPDTLEVLRKTLAAAEDGEVTLVVVGSLGSMERLVTSAPDEFSSLNGKELIEQKIKRTVVMGGRFFESWPMHIFHENNIKINPTTWEWNIKADGRGASARVFEQWPGELVLSSWEIGGYIKSMVGFASRARVGDPVATAYEVHNRNTGRQSWDHTAVLEAVRPGKYWNYHEFGRITVDDKIITHWNREEGGKQTYLLPKVDYEEIRQVIDDLVDGK